MSITAPSLSVCNLLDGQVMNPPAPGVTLQLGANLFRGPVRIPTEDGITVPHTAVFSLSRGGQKPVHYLRTDNADRLYADVSVLVRFDINHFEDGEDFARSIWRTLQRNIPANYLECHCMNSEPEYLGLDDTEHPMWNINLELVRVE